MVRVSLSEPTLVSELGNMLAATLDAEVRERGNRLEIEFRPSSELAPEMQVAKVRRLASAWQVAGHPHVRANVTLVALD